MADNLRSIDDANFDEDVFSLTWEKSESGDGIVVTRIRGRARKLAIPETIDGLPVTEIRGGIGSRSYREAVESGATQLRSLDLPTTLKKIGPYAFSYCMELERALLPEGVEEMGEGAFAHCRQLSILEIPGSLKRVPVQAFADCKELSFVSFREGVRSVGDEAFRFCGKVKFFGLPKSLTEIGSKAFYDSESIGHLVIENHPIILLDHNVDCRSDSFPEGTTIARLPNTPPFENKETPTCYKGDHFTLQLEMTEEKDGIAIVDISGSAESIVIPEFIEGLPVVEIRRKRKYDSSISIGKELKEIALPRTLKRIGTRAFYSCSNLVSVVLSEGLKRSGSALLRNAPL